MFHLDLTVPTDSIASHTLLHSLFHLLIILLYAYLVAWPYRPPPVYKPCSNVESTSDDLIFMLYIQSSLSAAQTQGWNCAAFRSDPIRGKNPFRMTPRSSKSVQKSLTYQHIFENID